jgi:hypothetical protein
MPVAISANPRKKTGFYCVKQASVKVILGSNDQSWDVKKRERERERNTEWRRYYKG